MLSRAKRFSLHLAIAASAAFLAVSFGCFNSGYENVRMKADDNRLYFHPDDGAPREPMPLNIRTRFAGTDNLWGILLWVPYRETGLGAINRTIFTTVLYLTAVDGNLNQLIGKPLVISINEGHVPGDIFSTPGGVGVAHMGKDGRLVCNVYDPGNRLAVKESFTIPNGHRIIMTDRSQTDLALRYHGGSIYGLAGGEKISLLKAGAGGILDEIAIEPGRSRKGSITTGDIWVNDSGVHALWAETSAPCSSKDCATFYHAYRPHVKKDFTIKELPIRGDNPNTLKVSFGKSGPTVTVLLQEGNVLWEGTIDANSGTIRGLTTLLTVGAGKYPSPAIYSCTATDCHVFFHKPDGPWVYSKKTGLRRSDGIQYRRAVECSETGCIQETSDKGILMLKEQ